MDTPPSRFLCVYVSNTVCGNNNTRNTSQDTGKQIMTDEQKEVTAKVTYKSRSSRAIDESNYLEIQYKCTSRKIISFAFGLKYDREHILAQIIIYMITEFTEKESLIYIRDPTLQEVIVFSSLLQNSMIVLFKVSTRFDPTGLETFQRDQSPT